MKERASKDKIRGEFEKLYKKVSKKDILRAVEELDKTTEIKRRQFYEKPI